MFINALNSDANCYMTDLEDSQAPSWSGIVQSHQNIFDATRGQLSVESKGKTYKVAGPTTPSLLVRARGLHMVEEHVIDESGRAVPATLFDIASYLFHNSGEIIAKGKRPLLYQPKLESYEEAVLVHDMVQQMEKKLGIPYGTCRITALIETLPGIIQADEIIFGLGAYCAGLNCGRWDYIFSAMKLQQNNAQQVFPDRASLTMDKPFLTQYMQRVVQASHTRGVHALGGMSAFLPVSTMSPEESAKALQKVIADKTYELAQGCDGAWVAHPSMVKPIQDLFNRTLDGADNQISSKINRTADCSDVAGFTRAPAGQCTEAGLRENVFVGVKYLAAWLGGSGAVAINHQMEDLATAEISRTQVWTWFMHNQLLTHEVRTKDIYTKVLAEEVSKLYHDLETSSLPTAEKNEAVAHLAKGWEIFDSLVRSPTLTPFLQNQAYAVLNCGVAKPSPLKSHFVAMQFDNADRESLRGSLPSVTLNATLSILRGDTFNQKMYALRDDGLVPHGSFIGTPTGHGARNVVEGGLGLSWPYIGGIRGRG